MYTGHSEQQFSEFREARRRTEERPIRSQRATLQAQRNRRVLRTGGPSAYASKGDPGAVCR